MASPAYSSVEISPQLPLHPPSQVFARLEEETRSFWGAILLCFSFLEVFLRLINCRRPRASLMLPHPEIRGKCNILKKGTLSTVLSTPSTRWRRLILYILADNTTIQ